MNKTSAMTHGESLSLARREHRLSYEPANGLGTYWSCSCGARAARRLIPPTDPMARAAAARHVEAVARRIRTEATS